MLLKADPNFITHVHSGNAASRRRRRRALWLLAAMAAAFLLLLGHGGTAHAAPNRVTIANLTDDNVFIAAGQEYGGSTRAGDFTTLTGPRVVFGGWRKIEPGKSFSFPPEYTWFLALRNGRRVSWPNRDERTGLFRLASFNNVRLDYDPFQIEPDPGSLTYQTNQGYETEIYQRLPSGFYTVSGDAYEVRTRDFNFDFSSHSRTAHNDCYEVPGTVVHYTFQAERKHGPEDTWTQHERKVCLGLITKGVQQSAFAGREKGYFRGRLTVHYSVPAASTGGSSLTLQEGFLPDPHRTSVTARGERAASDIASGCSGYVPRTPTATLTWNGDTDDLRIFVRSSTDTVLVVKDQAGRVRCNDDWDVGDTNPLVEPIQEVDAVYTIWVGTFSEGDQGSATLYFSEFSGATPANPEG